MSINTVMKPCTQKFVQYVGFCSSKTLRAIARMVGEQGTLYDSLLPHSPSFLVLESIITAVLPPQLASPYMLSEQDIPSATKLSYRIGH